MRPFRWDLAARLPDLTRVPALVEPWSDFRDDLLRLTARIVRRAGDADLVFVGRSLESVHDLLGGLLAGSSWAGRARLLPFSAMGPFLDLEALGGPGLRAHFAAAGLDPLALVRSRRPIALVDVVASGETLGRVVATVRRWCREERGDAAAVWRKLSIVAVRDRSAGRRFDWRVEEEGAAWLAGVPALRVGSLHIEDRLWFHLADRQPKVTPSHTPDRW